MKPKIYVFVSGGVVQGMRADVPADVTLIDYDNFNAGEIDDKTGEPFETVEDFEISKLGCERNVMEAHTVPIF